MTDFYNIVSSAPKGRYDGIERNYTAEDVKRLRGSVDIKYSLAEMGAKTYRVTGPWKSPKVEVVGREQSRVRQNDRADSAGAP